MADAFRIDIGSRNNTIDSNTIKDYGHAGIYFIGSTTNSSDLGVYNNTAKNNYLSGEKNTYFRCFNIDGLYINHVYNNLIYNNTCYNTTVMSQLNGNNNIFDSNTINYVRHSDRAGKSYVAVGISFDEYYVNGSSDNNIIINNLIMNTEEPCITFGGNFTNVTLRNNTLTNCSTNATYYNSSEIAIQNSMYYDMNLYPIIKNFTFTRGLGRISLRGYNGTVAVQDDSPVQIFDLSGKSVLMNFTGTKNATYKYSTSAISNFTIYNASPPNNNVKNLADNTILAYNIVDYSIILNAIQKNIEIALVNYVPVPDNGGCDNRIGHLMGNAILTMFILGVLVFFAYGFYSGGLNGKSILIIVVSGIILLIGVLIIKSVLSGVCGI